MIGISGHAYSGKDTFSNYFIKLFSEIYSVVFEQLAFATCLKELCRDQFNLTYDQLWGDLKEAPDERYSRPSIGSITPTEYWTPREIMQSVGELNRSIDTDYWVRLLDKKIKHFKYKNVIITDVRHINESEYIKSNGGLLIQICRDGKVSNSKDHISEVGLDNVGDDYFNLVVNNNGSLDDLYSVTKDIVKNIDKLTKINKGELKWQVKK